MKYSLVKLSIKVIILKKKKQKKNPYQRQFKEIKSKRDEIMEKTVEKKL